MKEVFVTIAIPFYNAEKYLAQAIDSVVWQTYHNWELLLIDDGSTDRSLEIAKEYVLKDKRIKIFSDGDNKNLGYRLNQIPNLVDTLYLARMDADDLMDADRLKIQLDYLKNNISYNFTADKRKGLSEFWSLAPDELKSRVRWFG